MAPCYQSRLRVPVAGSGVQLYTATGLAVCAGFKRVVIGGRGPYVEFDDSQASMAGFKQVSTHWYYVEWRTADSANVKLYRQLRRVDYADYLPDMWYASPFELFLPDGTVVIDQLRKAGLPPPTLFD